MAMIVRPLPGRPRRGWLIGLALTWLVGVLLAASPAVASHPTATLTAAAAEGDSGAADPLQAEGPPPAAPVTAALICLALPVLPALFAARRWRRVAPVATLALLVWLSAESAFHSAHHLREPGEAERCPVFSAAQHVPGVAPGPSAPVLDRPAPTVAAPLPPPAIL